MRKGRIVLGLSLALVLGAAATYREQREVVVIRTLDGDGTAYDTKVWVVDHDGVPWVDPGGESR